MPFQDETGTCTTAQYTDLTSDGHFKVWNSGQDAEFGSRGGIHGRVKCPETDGQCFVTFFTPFTKVPNYIVIDTDYENYSMVYSCHSGPTADLWILSRAPVMDDDLYSSLLDRAADLLPQFDFSTLNSPRTIQGDQCSYVNTEVAFWE